MSLRRILSFTAVMLFLFASVVPSQPAVRITAVRSLQGSASAELFLRTRCGDAPCLLSPWQVHITDNGHPVQEFTIIEHPSPESRKKISVGLVLDASMSMDGPKHDATRTAARAFVDFMDGDSDEATVLWFNHQIWVRNIMIPVRHILYEAIDSLPHTGGTRLWDAIWAGILEVHNNGVNEKRAVVVITDGDDNCSTRSPEEVIQFAQRVNMRVFTIGLGAHANCSMLRRVAEGSGGEYYDAPNPADLRAIFLEAAAFTSRGFDEHRIVFTTPDPDAHAHVITLRIEEAGSSMRAAHAELVDGTASGEHPAIPAGQIRLDQNSPNPFSPETGTTIVYEIRGETMRHVLLDIFDRLGRHVSRIVDEAVLPGIYTARYAGTGLSRGTYFCVLRTGDAVLARQMVLK